MLNFLFEGAIGELLAPVSSPYHQLQLAIQRQENDKVHELLTSGGLDAGFVGEKTGLAPIHYAAKFNNRMAVELILSQGVSVNQPDRNGNTALHYAAAGGHFDLVQLLISQHAAPAARNQTGKTPYDMSSSILVSQYLMPLQLAAEQDDAAGYATPPQGYAGGYPRGYSGYPGFGQPDAAGQMYAPAPANFSSATMQTPAIASYPMGAPTVAVSSTVGTADATYPAGATSTWASSTTASPAVTTQTAAAAASSSGSSRTIRPDGFHSSATDPALQAKYGHTQHVQVTAPPPTGAHGAPPSYHMFTPQAPQPSLYVPYDFQTGSHTRQSPPPPAVGQFTAPPTVHPVGGTPPFTPAPAPQQHSETTRTNSPTHRTASTGQSSTPLVHLNVFNPAADSVVSASSTSSSVL